MNISVFIVECIIMAMVFGIFVFGLLLISPLTFISDYPPDMIVLAAFDTCFLDWILFANIRRIRLPGTEHMEKEYHQKWFHVKVMLRCSRCSLWAAC